MRRIGSETIAFSAGLAVIGAAFLAALNHGTPVQAANQPMPANAPAHLETTSDGIILISSNGMTLYVNGADRGGQSTCTNVVNTVSVQRNNIEGYDPVRIWANKSCLDKWPPYLADANAQAVGDFGLQDRPEGGKKQWTWKGQPLYFSVKDQKPGDHWGAAFQFTTTYGVGGGRGGQQQLAQQGRGGGGFRYASVQYDDFPPVVRLTRYETELVLSTPNGRPVYTPKKSSATRGEDMLQPILAGEMARVSGDWSIVDAGDGRQQYAFRGKPLYSMPDGIHDSDVAEAGGWDMVVYQKGAGTPPEIQTRDALLGTLYTTKDGLTLYQFSCGGAFGRGGGISCDGPGDPAQYWVAVCGTGKECAERWKPYLAPANAKPQGEWSVTDVAYPIFTDPYGATYPPEAPRVKAWAYRGKPVYTYYEDKEAGDIWGHNVRWSFGGVSFGPILVAGRGLERGG